MMIEFSELSFQIDILRFSIYVSIYSASLLHLDDGNSFNDYLNIRLANLLE